MSPVRKIGREEFKARMLQAQRKRRDKQRAEELAAYDVLWVISEHKYRSWKKTHRRK